VTVLPWRQYTAALNLGGALHNIATDGGLSLRARPRLPRVGHRLPPAGIPNTQSAEVSSTLGFSRPDIAELFRVC
jgi:hypothetical protein